jgi:hypothetical protein
MKRAFLLLTAACAALTTAAAAQVPGPRGPRGPAQDFGVSPGFGLLQFDANADGRLTRAEFDAGQRTRFNQLDGNKDGSATPEEIQAGMQAQAEARREAAQKARFAEMDKDKNGQVSQSEFLAAGADRPDGPRGLRLGGPDGPQMPRLAAGGPPGPGGPPLFDGRGPRGFGGRGGPPGFRGPGPQGGPPTAAQGAPAADQPRRAGPADADGDGKLTFAEFSARGVEAFTRADADKNGTITIAELQALPAGPR